MLITLPDTEYRFMVDFGLLTKLVRLTRLTLTDIEAQIQIQSQLIDIIYTKHGLKQGDDLVPMLFNIALDYVTRKLSVDMRMI